jgi:hypothetical protein
MTSMIHVQAIQCFNTSPTILTVSVRSPVPLPLPDARADLNQPTESLTVSDVKFKHKVRANI